MEGECPLSFIFGKVSHANGISVEPDLAVILLLIDYLESEERYDRWISPVYLHELDQCDGECDDLR